MEIVYKIPGKNHGPEGKTYDWVEVKTEDELEGRLKDGWFETLEEAVKGELVRARNENGEYVGDNPATPDVNEAYTEAPATREEMLKKAKELKLKFHKNISDKKLLELIEEKLKDS